MKVELHIAELIVDGVPGVDEATLRASLSAEIGRLLTERGIPAAWNRSAEIGAINAGAITVNQGTAVGEQVAGAVVEGFGR